MLTATIRTDMTAAMKARDEIKTQTLRGALAAFTNELVAKGRKPTEELSDPEALNVLKRLVKQRKEAIELYTKGGRPELADKESAEIAVLGTYIPKGAGKEEIEKVARAKKEELGVRDASGIGTLTGAIMKEFAGRADGNDVKEVVQSLFT
jgi:uncharacterized protein YqeY